MMYTSPEDDYDTMAARIPQHPWPRERSLSPLERFDKLEVRRRGVPPPPVPPVMQPYIPLKKWPPRPLESPEEVLYKEVNRSKSELQLYHYNIIRTVLQEGPLCGMTALAMAINDNEWPQEKLCELARSREMSNMGEMFSCQWLLEMAGLVNCERYCLIRDGILNHLHCMFKCITLGGYALVPYDKDADGSPCQKSGHKAHWAILNGFAICRRNAGAPISTLKKRVSSKNRYICDCEEKLKLHREIDEKDRRKWASVKNKLRYAHTDTTHVVVFAHQGNSKHVRLWSVEDLAASNGNLKMVSPHLKDKIRLPEGGIEAGLCNQAILLYPPYSERESEYVPN